MEKPFGHDLDSGQKLNEELRTVFAEKQIYRIDHYLGKETVQNVFVLRFANGIFEPLWNNRYVDNVQIAVAETVGVGHRAGYYETAGIIRDMFQNHLLQLLCLTAMEPPVIFEADAVRAEKVKVLQSIRPFAEDAIDDWAVRGQYGPGVVGGKTVPGYRQEERVDPNSATATYAAVKFAIDNWRWAGVPFYIRSGKRLAARISEIAIEFKRVPHPLFSKQAGALNPNVLRLRIQPDEGVSLKFEAKIPGTVLQVQSVYMDFPLLQARSGDSGRLRAPAPRRHPRRSDALHARRRGRACLAGGDADPSGAGRRRSRPTCPTTRRGRGGRRPRTSSSSAKADAGGLCEHGRRTKDVGRRWAGLEEKARRVPRPTS